MKSKFNWIIIGLLVLPLIVAFFFPASSYDFKINNFFGYGLFEYEFSANNFMTIFGFVLIFVVASIGLNVQVGYAGQLNLGYVAFMAIGGYTAALFQDAHPELYLNYPFFGILCSLALAAFSAALVGLLACLPTMRLRGDYFAIVTFGFAEVVRLIIKNEETLGGASGINNVFFLPEKMVDGFENSIASNFLSAEAMNSFNGLAWLRYLFFLALAAVLIYVVVKLRDSHYGRMLFSIRDNETAAEACGISLAKGKLYAFIVSAAIGGIAGYMMVVRNSQAHPQAFVFMISIYALCSLVLGGIGSVRGAVLGALILMSLGEFLRDVLIALPANSEGSPLVPSEARIILFGLVLILMMRFRPNGICTLESDTARLTKKKEEGGDASSYYDLGDEN